MYDLFNYRLNDICLHRRCDLASFQSIRDFVTQFNKQVVDSRIATKQTMLCTDFQNLTNISINKEEKCDVLINNAGIMKCRKMHTQVCWCSHAWCIRIENVDQNRILFHHWCTYVCHHMWHVHVSGWNWYDIAKTIIVTICMIRTA